MKLFGPWWREGLSFPHKEDNLKPAIASTKKVSPVDIRQAIMLGRET
jgi:hypothetical protein